MQYSITYEVITPESAENGDFEETGFYIEDGEDDLRDVINLAESLGICEDSGSWFSSVDPEIDYQSGAETFYSLHPRVTPATYNRISKILSI